MAVSDSLFRLSAGKYKIKSYTTKKKNKGSLEYGEVNLAAMFTLPFQYAIRSDDIPDPLAEVIIVRG